MLTGIAPSALALLTGGAGANPPPAPGIPWIWVVGLILIFYFMMIRPQMKEQKKRREMVAALKKNDKVMTTSGMYGQIVSLDEHSVVLKVDDNVRIRFTRAAIDRAIVQEDAAEA